MRILIIFALALVLATAGLAAVQGICLDFAPVCQNAGYAYSEYHSFRDPY